MKYQIKYNGWVELNIDRAEAEILLRKIETEKELKVVIDSLKEQLAPSYEVEIECKECGRKLISYFTEVPTKEGVEDTEKEAVCSNCLDGK